MSYTTKTSLIAQLNELSLEELLEFKRKINELVEVKLSDISKSDATDLFLAAISSSSIKGTIRYTLLSKEAQAIHFYEDIRQLITSEDVRENSLGNIIELVDEWMNDESEYDEVVYSDIEAGLDQNKLSF